MEAPSNPADKAPPDGTPEQKSIFGESSIQLDDIKASGVLSGFGTVTVSPENPGSATPQPLGQEAGASRSCHFCPSKQLRCAADDRHLCSRPIH